MKQYGDITKLSGYDLDPVDLIVGGSPCQDLSVAGQRKGLEGKRSGLFLEMIRIIKEMREKTNGIYPRYALWENVPGAFSSNNGKDYSAVLGEFARIAEPDAPDVPVPQEGWPKAGVLLGSNWSIAWRTHDAQFWGVPQRRRRIALVADFREQSAWEILFERKSLPGDIDQSKEEGEDIAGTSEDSTGKTVIMNPRPMSMVCGENTAPKVGADDYKEPQIVLEERERERERTLSFQERSGKPGGGKGILIQMDHTGAISTMNNQAVLDDRTFCLQGNMIGRDDKNGPQGDGINEDVAFKVNATDRHAVFDSQVYHSCREFDDGISQTVNAQYGTGGNNQPLVVSDDTPVANGNGQLNQITMSDKANALDTMHDQQAIISYGIDRASFNQGKNAQFDISITEEKIGAQVAKGPGAGLPPAGTVRRLTPLECTRLQGYPDGWVDLPGASDSAKYKALGNSIALPAWEFWARRFVEMGGVQTIGSLFDGIGGFPLVFKRAGAETLWTSEIEPFCQKVVEWHVAKGDL